MSGVAPFGKALVAFLVAGLGSLAAQRGRGIGAALAVGLAAAAAVYVVPNAPDVAHAPGAPDVNDDGEMV
jgi:hypothetical protein